jgi:uncharacterized protein YodC (DUF2158 family)
VEQWPPKTTFTIKNHFSILNLPSGAPSKRWRIVEVAALTPAASNTQFNGVREMRSYVEMRVSVAKVLEVNMSAFTKRASITTTLLLGIAAGMAFSIPAFSASAQSDTAMQSEPAPPFRPGDLVRLRSGGPLMTVANVKGRQVDCFWTDGSGQPNAESFVVEVLQKF